MWTTPGTVSNQQGRPHFRWLYANRPVFRFNDFFVVPGVNGSRVLGAMYKLTGGTKNPSEAHSSPHPTILCSKELAVPPCSLPNATSKLGWHLMRVSRILVHYPRAQALALPFLVLRFTRKQDRAAIGRSSYAQPPRYFNEEPRKGTIPSSTRHLDPLAHKVRTRWSRQSFRWRSYVAGSSHVHRQTLVILLHHSTDRSAPMPGIL